MKVVIIQISTNWIIQIKKSETGYHLRSYHNQDRKVPVKHGDTKPSVSIGHHEVSKLRLQVLWQFSFFIQNTNIEGGIFCSVYWILKTCTLFIRMLIVIWIICSLFIQANMLRTQLLYSVQIQTNTKEHAFLCTWKNHEKQLLQGVLNNSEKQLPKVFWIKAVKVSKSTGDNHPEKLFQ